MRNQVKTLDSMVMHESMGWTESNDGSFFASGEAHRVPKGTICRVIDTRDSGESLSGRDHYFITCNRLGCRWYTWVASDATEAVS